MSEGFYKKNKDKAVYFDKTKEKREKKKPKRYFNWKLAAVLIISLCVLGVGAFALRQWHKSNRSQQGLVQGLKAYTEGRWADAAEHLGRYLVVRRDDVSILLKYADAQLKIRPTKRNHMQQAIQAYRTILRVDKDNSEAVTRLIDIYMAIGPGEAELIARRQLEMNPDPTLGRMLAQALIAQRKFEEAATILKDILKEHPDQVLVYETLGRLVELRPQDFEEMPAYWFDKAVEMNPSSALAYIIRGAFFRRNKEIPNAFTDLEQAEGLELSDANVRLRLAEEFIYSGQLEKAETHLIAVREAMPDDQGLWNIWAQYAFKTGSKEKMLHVAEEGLEALASQPWDFMPIAAELYIKCGRLDDANECIAKLNKRGIKPATVAFLRGAKAAKQGRLREAAQRWRQAMDSGNRSSQVRLELSWVLSRLGDMQSSERLLRTLISEKPDSLRGHLALAKLFAQSGNWAETAQQARRASELQPGNVESGLLYLKAQLKLLRINRSNQGVEHNELIRAVGKQLSDFKKVLGQTADVTLLEFEFALLKEKYTDAEKLLDQLKKTGLPPAEIALREVDLLTAQNKNDQAIQRLDAAIEAFPESIKLVRYLAFLSDQEGRRTKCEETLKQALTHMKEPISQRNVGLLLAWFYRRWERQDDALRLLLTLSQKLPDDIPIKRRLLLFPQIMKDTEKAQSLVDEIKSLEGEDGWQWRYEQARLWFEGDNFENRHPEIVSLLQENMLANPSDQASRVLLARCHERAGDLQLAISTYREALRKTPDDLRVIVPMVAALHKAKAYDEAEKIMKRASREKLSHPELRRWEYLDCLRRGELDSASGILEDIVNNDPNNQEMCLALAMLKIQQNKLDEAEEILDRLKRQNPLSIPVTGAQIQISLRRNDTAEALRLSNELVRDLDHPFAYILRARTFASLRRFDRAVEDIEQAAVLDPNSVHVWVAKSDFYRTIGRIDKAIADIRQALSLNPNSISIQKSVIEILFASGEPDKMREGEILLDKALAANAEDVDLRLLKVRALLAKSTEAAINEADQVLEKITEDQPDMSEAWMLKGEIAIRRGQPGRAIDAALSGLAYRSDDRDLLLLKARAEAMRSPVLAAPTLKELHEMDPNDSGVAIFLANTYIEAGEPEKAVALMRKQLKQCEESDRKRCRIALTIALYKNGNKNRALNDLDALMKAEPSDPNPLLVKTQLLKEDRLWSELEQQVIDWYEKHPKGGSVLATVARDLGTITDSQAKQTAENILQAVRQKDPNSVEALNVLGVLYIQTPGRMDEAVEIYNRILEQDPNHLIALNNLAWILSEEQEKPQEALELAQRGLKINPRYIDLLDTRGVIYYRLGEYDKAIEDFTRCIQLYASTAPAGVGSRFHLARAYAMLDYHSEAIEQLNRALDMQSRIGGLTPTDVDEARRLLKNLQEGR